MKSKKYKLTWYNGYYDVSVEISATSIFDANKIGKKAFGHPPGAFAMGENPKANFGLYGEAIIYPI